MNRTDRLLAIVLELQAKRAQRAEDLAATFEISKRTVYRDIQALCEAGVPVVATPGRGYSLVEGYFLPPLTFTSAEATILLLGAEFLAQRFDAQYRAAARAAERKIAAVLPARLRPDVDNLRRSMRFVALSPGDGRAEPAALPVLRQAILDERTVRFRYYARHRGAPDGGTPDLRQADPYALVYLSTAWYLTAYCHTRRAIRHFRLDRMEDLRVLDRPFHRPADFETIAAERADSRTYRVRALFTPAVARWVREAPHYFTVAEDDTPDGLLVTLQARQEADVLQWLLGWGAQVRVLEPDSLRARLAAEATEMLRLCAPPLLT